MKINKGFLKLYAALLILVFHFWIKVTGSVVEAFIVETAYVGVDIFFFLSAYSLADKKIEYKSFIKNRVVSVYFKFLVFTIINAIYKGWKLQKFLLTVTFVEMFTRGGGSYLWFVPAIMIFYFLFPLFINWENKHKCLIVLLGWLVLAFALTNFTSYKALFIVINRIPIIMVAYYLKNNKVNGNWLMALLTVVGLALMWFFKFSRPQLPIYDNYYLAVIPFVVGITGLSGYLPRSKVVDFLGSFTLEVYAVQMTFGFNVANKLFKMLRNGLVTNILTIVIIFVISYIASEIFKKVTKLILKEAK